MIKQLCFVFLCFRSIVGTFLCGPEALGKVLEKKCAKYSDVDPRKTRFYFNKENFWAKKKKNKQTREKQEARSHISKDNNQLELCLASEEKCQNIEENQCDRTSVYRPSSIYSEGSTEAWWVILISGAQGFAPFFPLWSKESLRLHIYICIYLCHIRLHYCSTWLKLQGRFMLLRWGPWFLDLLNMKVLTEREKLLLYKILTNGVYLLFIMIL